METILGGIAFACLIAAQFFAVVAVRNARRESDSRSDVTHFATMGVQNISGNLATDFVIPSEHSLVRSSFHINHGAGDHDGF
jgi:hypothetical protein